jgi:hypothetical protein
MTAVPLIELNCEVRSQWPRGSRHELSSNAPILGPNLTRGTAVCVCVVLCSGRNFGTGSSIVKKGFTRDH